ncbi:MAG: hypothetical protein ACTTGX_02835 [Candidatus Cryptobacteroides sp.]
MSKKAIILSIILLLSFTMLIVFAVFRLYDGERPLKITSPQTSYIKQEEIVKDTIRQIPIEVEIFIPKGPYIVKNCGSGKDNLLYQQENLNIGLKEMSGKELWNISFNTPICGKVATIDYYGNKKLQFLFASEDKLYLIDRLGRNVKPFPVTLPKKVLLGPDVYDFTGAHGYTVIILHTDNTLEMYNLHGKKPKNWKGFNTKGTIIDMPKLIISKGLKYWSIQTTEGTQLFDKNGGTPLN